MSDCEVSEEVWESLFSPGKKKRKKKVKPSPMKKTNLSNKTQGNNTTKKRKKSSKFKEAMDERKAKRKEKKKKKKDKLAAKLQDKIVNDDSSNLVNKTPEKVTADAKKSKRKKQVAFDIPHNYIRVKRPKFSSFLPPPQDSTSPVNKVMVETEIIEPSQVKPSDSQSTSDDMHSQDLFITQKTFRVPLSEMSSEDASDKFEDNTKVAQIFYSETKCLFHTQKTKPKTELCHENLMSSPRNLFLDAPIVVSSPPNEKKKDCIVLSPLCHSSQLQKSMISSFTQTENFFTTELTLYLNFCQKSNSNAQSDEVKPLDLSLPNRARRDFSTVIIDLCEGTNVKQNPTVTHGGSVQPSWPERAQGKEEATPSPESEQKSADTTTSSEDNEAPRTSRLDLMQVRAVQMRLNESFFFKTKGEGPSPRAESPLMKLVQGRELKSRKPH